MTLGTGIIRAPTSKELDTSPDYYGEPQGFIPIGYGLSEEEEVSVKGREIETRLSNRNRKIIALSEDPLKEIKNLTCPTCFFKEFMKDLTEGADVKAEFEKYMGRLSLHRIDILNTHSKFKSSTEFSVSLSFNQCICGKKSQLGFTKEELTKKGYDNLVKQSSIQGSTNLDSW